MIATSKKPKGFLNLAKDLYNGVVIVITTPIRIVALTRELVRNGCFTVETEFVYNQKSFYIRTLIQPDADIITIIGVPQLNEMPLEELELDDKGSQYLMKNYEVHNQKLISAFADLQGRQEFFGFLIDSSLIATTIYPLYDAFVTQSQETYILAGVVAVASVAFRMFAKKFITNKLVQGVFYFAKKWIERKIGNK